MNDSFVTLLHVSHFTLAVDREKPETREGFKHPRVIEWTLENRFRLMEACLTIIKAWIDAGMPLPKDVVWGLMNGGHK